MRQEWVNLPLTSVVKYGGTTNRDAAVLLWKNLQILTLPPVSEGLIQTIALGDSAILAESIL